MLLSDLASLWFPLVGRSVTDDTGLTGRFDVDLEWAPTQSDLTPVAEAAANLDNKPSIFTA
jgi:uncharacterized protein (TIGR03435 family)